VVAGINAALQVRGEEPLVLERDEAYIGVLIDDLVTRGVDEPYRLFTSRAEFRLLLRQDNAHRRLGVMARERGFLTEGQEAALERRLAEEARVQVWFERTSIEPEQAQAVLEHSGSDPLSQPVRAAELLRRPNVTARALIDAADHVEAPSAPDSAVTTVEVELKYAGYVARERERAERLREQAQFSLEEDLPYEEFVTLSWEAREKLGRVRPGTLAQAGRIPGVSPADLQNLVLEVRRRRAGERERGGTRARAR
jgi:tRNA uridine 5-carboxymethylaminomethyl modification enzyme